MYQGMVLFVWIVSPLTPETGLGETSLLLNLPHMTSVKLYLLYFVQACSHCKHTLWSQCSYNLLIDVIYILYIFQCMTNLWYVPVQTNGPYLSLYMYKINNYIYIIAVNVIEDVNDLKYFSLLFKFICMNICESYICEYMWICEKKLVFGICWS